MAAKKRSPRAERRAVERDARKDVQLRARMLQLSPGGAPERPIEVGTASLVEPTARALRCALCDGALQLDEHAAETRDGIALRVAKMRCVRCGAPREVWFRIVSALLN
jgi:hypothetical protein